MPLKKVLMAEFSDIRYDARVLKQAYTLSEGGFLVHLIMYNSCILKTKKTKSHNMDKTEIPFKRRHSTKTKLDKFIRLFSFFYVFIQYFFRSIVQKADYYHAHNYFIGWILWLSALIHGGKFIYDCHEIIWTEKEPYHKVGVYVEKFLLSEAALAICPSADRAKLIKDYYRIKKNLISLYNYPVYREEKELKSNLLKNELGVNQNTNILIFTGMLAVKTRLQDNVIKSIPKLNEDVIFVIIGYGHPEEIFYLYEVADRNEVRDKLYILPPKPHEQLKKYIQSADIGISLLKDYGLAYRYHTLNKFYDYISGGVAVLASDFPSFRKEILDNPIGPIGVVCDEENPDSISKNIQYLLDNKKRLDSIKANSRRLHESLWNWQKQAKILLDSYKNL